MVGITVLGQLVFVDVGLEFDLLTGEDHFALLPLLLFPLTLHLRPRPENKCQLFFNLSPSIPGK